MQAADWRMTMKEDTAELYRQREKRVNDAIALRVPDRIPLLVMFGFFPAKYAGMTIEEVMYEDTPRIQTRHGSEPVWHPFSRAYPGGPRF
jgi:hypothetical protein